MGLNLSYFKDRQYNQEIVQNLQKLYLELDDNNIGIVERFDRITKFNNALLNEMCTKYGEDKRQKFRQAITLAISAYTAAQLENPAIFDSLMHSEIKV